MRTLMSYLPDRYPASRETVVFQEALQPEIDAVWAARDDLLAQLSPYTATWGLDLWEDVLAPFQGRCTSRSGAKARTQHHGPAGAGGPCAGDCGPVGRALGPRLSRTVPDCRLPAASGMTARTGGRMTATRLPRGAADDKGG